MSVKPQGTQKKERQGSTRTATSVACSRPAWEFKVHEDDLTTPSDRSSLPWKTANSRLCLWICPKLSMCRVPNLGSARIVEDSLPKAEKFSAKQCMQSRVQTTGVPRCLPRGAVSARPAFGSRTQCLLGVVEMSRKKSKPKQLTGVTATGAHHPAATGTEKRGAVPERLMKFSHLEFAAGSWTVRSPESQTVLHRLWVR